MTRIDLDRTRYADIVDPDVYVRGVPHATFKRLRDEEPVSWWDEKEGSGFWALARYEDIVSASQNCKVFSSSRGIRLEEMTDEELQARRTMMEMDPPEHTNYRRIVQPPFTYRAIGRRGGPRKGDLRLRRRDRPPIAHAHAREDAWNSR